MNFKPLLFIPPVALGVAGFMWMTQPQDEQVKEREDTRQAVRVMSVVAEPVEVTATGYGRVEAERSWTAVSQVDGRIIQRFEDLAVGTLVEEGAVLVQIDPTDYEIAIQKSKANIASANASLAELDRQEANSRRSLEVEQRILKVARAEYERVSSLVERGTSSNAALDTAQKALLAQETSITNLNNTLALFPAQRASVEATLAVRKAELTEAERGLENTTLTAPFRGRVSESDADTGQFVRTGEQLLGLDDIDSVEVVAAFQPQSFAPVIQTALGRSFREATEVDAAKVVTYLNQSGVSAVVRMELADFKAEFPAELVRFRGTIDSETGTIGMAVRVEHPLLSNGDRQRPPLNVGSFVSVDLRTSPEDDAIAIPRSTVHHDDNGAPFVYVADADDRLAITPIVPGPVVGDRILVKKGLAAGDQLLLSTPRPPIEGMLLTPVPVDGGA